MKDKIEVVAFDADDTLWENEVYFQEFEHQFCDLLKAYQPQSAVSQELFKTEMKNLHMYGYGLKSMMGSKSPESAEVKFPIIQSRDGCVVYQPGYIALSEIIQPYTAYSLLTSRRAI